MTSANARTRVPAALCLFIALLAFTACSTRLYEGQTRPAAEIVTLGVRSPARDRPAQAFWRALTLGNLYWRYWRVELLEVDGRRVPGSRVDMLPGKHTVRMSASRGAAPLLPPYEVPLWLCKGSADVELTAGRYEVVFNYDVDRPRFRIEMHPDRSRVAEFEGACNGPTLLHPAP